MTEPQGEQCFRCHQDVGEIWHADDALWEAVAGEPGWRERAGELAYLGPQGCMCRECFMVQAEERGITTTLRVMRREDYVRWRDEQNAASWGDDAPRYWALHPENAPDSAVSRGNDLA